MRDYCAITFKQHMQADTFMDKFKMTLDNGRKVHAAQMRVSNLSLASLYLLLT